MIAINSFVDILSNTYNEVNDGEKKFAYFNDSGQLLCGDESLVIYEKEGFWENKDFASKSITSNEVVYSHTIEGSPLHVLVYDKVSAFENLSPQLIMTMVVFLIVTGVSLLLIGLFITVYITRPVEQLVHSMDSVKGGWLRRVSIKLSDDEIGQLKDSYNNMLVEINTLIEELVEKETAVQKAEMEALQEQIKPHFLYNTLDTIAYLALENPREEVYDTIETLGNFYRKFLSKGQTDITLADEMDITKNYLKLQKLRYGDIFTDEYRIDDEIANVKVPRLMLQPLVENALYHGVRLKGEMCEIKVSARHEGEFIIVSVYDTGVGMSKEKIEGIMERESNSFGFKKTIERVALYFDKEDIYEIKSREGYYFEVILKIPLERKINVSE
jgi:two-component system sensor histidine kinase YesM